MSSMRVGVVLMPTDSWTESVATARRVDELGFDHLWVYDHLSWQRYRERPWHATYPWLAGIAMATERIRLGTMVSNPNLRHPALLAKDAMTIDHISDGRLTIGIGAGGVGFDATVLGREVMTPKERVDRLAEHVEALDGLLRGTMTSYDGEHVVVDDARMHPGCVQRPRVPLAIAAGGRRSIALTARFGDAWITLGDTSGAPQSPASMFDAVRSQSVLLDEACASIDRDPTTIDRILLTGHTEERPLASLDAFADVVGRYGAIGITDVVVHHPRADDEAWDDDPAILAEIAARPDILRR